MPMRTYRQRMIDTGPSYRDRVQYYGTILTVSPTFQVTAGTKDISLASKRLAVSSGDSQAPRA
jgi:hypothetical protein